MDMPNLPSVLYMIGKFLEGKPKREANPLGSFNIGLWYSLNAIRVTILFRTIKLPPSNAMYHI